MTTITTQEINDLPKVVDDARSRYQGEGDFIIMGDLNANCRSINAVINEPIIIIASEQ